MIPLFIEKLKDAGYPQIGKETLFNNPRQLQWIVGNGWVYVPTLSELIEACGDAEFSIQIFKHGTSIGFPYRGNKDDMLIANTPEEAVANLWLELNKK